MVVTIPNDPVRRYPSICQMIPPDLLSNGRRHVADIACAPSNLYVYKLNERRCRSHKKENNRRASRYVPGCTNSFVDFGLSSPK